MNQAINEVIGEIKGPALQSLVSWMGAPTAMPASQSLLVWLKRLQPQHFGRCLARARELELAA